MADKNIHISDELLAAYLDGTASREEMQQVLSALAHDKLLQEVLATAIRVDNDLEASSQAAASIVPMMRMAAEADSNLCDVQCEQYILKRRGIDYDLSTLTTDALNNQWLKVEGMPLHHIGRLAEQNHLVVTRQYDATLDDLEQALALHHDIIAVVDSDKLLCRDIDEEDAPNHAVVVVGMQRSEGTITLFDPYRPVSLCHHTIPVFVHAWRESHNYLVHVLPQDTSKKANSASSYRPTPIDTSDAEVTDDLIELREAIAENAHDVWAAARMAEGWRYGPRRDDAHKLHPDLVPYSALRDSEKEYDRIMAMNTIRLVRKLGFDIVKQTESPLYRQFIATLHHPDAVGHCPQCKAELFSGWVFCGNCGHKIDWDDTL